MVSMHTGSLSKRDSRSTSAGNTAVDHTLWRKWSVAWLGAVVIAMLNATVRDVTYLDAVGKQAADQIASVALILLIGAYVAIFERRWPIPSARLALSIGASWAAATVVFEFALGFATGMSFSELAANYNLLDGKLWVLVPVSIAFLPAAARWVRLSRHNAAA